MWRGEDRLSNNELGSGGGAALAPGLQKLTALQTLEYVRGRMLVEGGMWVWVKHDVGYVCGGAVWRQRHSGAV